MAEILTMLDHVVETSSKIVSETSHHVRYGIEVDETLPFGSTR